MPHPVLQLRQAVKSWFSGLMSSYSSASVSSPASARARSPCAKSSREATSAPQLAIALFFRNSRRDVPLPSAIDHLELLARDVVDAGCGAGLRLQDLELVRLPHLGDEALSVALVAEVADPPDAARDALREHSVREPVGAEVALAGIADREVLPDARPLLPVLERGQRLVLLELGRAVRVIRAVVERPRAVGARRNALAAADALCVVDRNGPRGDPLRLLPGRAVRPLHRTRCDARRLVALHARARQERARGGRVLAALVLVDGAVVEFRRELVLRDARDRAGVATHALAQVEEHRPAPLLGGLLQRPLEVVVHRDENVSFHDRPRVGHRWQRSHASTPNARFPSWQAPQERPCCICFIVACWLRFVSR